jgi:hypothetical protein
MRVVEPQEDPVLARLDRRRLVGVRVARHVSERPPDRDTLVPSTSLTKTGARLRRTSIRRSVSVLDERSEHALHREQRACLIVEPSRRAASPGFLVLSEPSVRSEGWIGRPIPIAP